MLEAIAILLTCTAFFLYLYWADGRRDKLRRAAIAKLERCWEIEEEVKIMSRRPTEDRWDAPPKPRPRRRNDSGTAIAVGLFTVVLILYLTSKTVLPWLIVAGAAAVLYIIFSGRGR